MGYYISQKDWDKIINYAKASYNEWKAEIGGMSICYKDGEGDWIVTDPVILEQEVTSGTCDLDKEALADYYCKAAKKHAKREFRFCWWHSHHTMGVFWSGTDLKGIEEYSGGDLSFALVVNLKEESKFRVSVWEPVVAHQDVELQIMGTEKNVPKKIVDEVKELCGNRIAKTYNYGYTTGRTGQAYRSADQLDLYGGYGMGWSAAIDDDYEIDPKDKEYAFVFDKVFEWMDLLMAGDLTYMQYQRDYLAFNDQLLSNKSKWYASEIPQSDLTAENLAWGDPADYVEQVPKWQIERKRSLLNANNGKV